MPIPTDRQDVSFDSGGLTCRGWLYLPTADAPPPVIVMAHGLGAVKEMRLDAFAERFRAAGYACLVFDYRHFGDSDGQPRQLIDIDSQLADWSAAVDFVRSRTDVDGTRVVLWGTSFAGGHVIVSAARLPGITAVISQCPFTDGAASALASHPISFAKVLPKVAADLIGSWRGGEPVMVTVAGPPGSAALMASPDAVSGYLGLVPHDMTIRNEAAARIGAHVMASFPGRSAKRVACPILFCVCDTDTVAPAKATVRHARKASRAEIVRYPFGHFNIYVGQGFERAVADQIDFLSRHLPLD